MHQEETKREHVKRGHRRRASVGDDYTTQEALPKNTHTWLFDDIDLHLAQRQAEADAFDAIWKRGGIKAREQLMQDELAGSQNAFNANALTEKTWHMLNAIGQGFSEVWGNMSFVGSAHAGTPSETLMVNMHQADMMVDALSGGRAGAAGLGISGLTRFLAKYGRPLVRQVGKSSLKSVTKLVGATKAEVLQSKKLLPGEGEVGSYNQLKKIEKIGDNLTPHHMPQSSYSKIRESREEMASL